MRNFGSKSTTICAPIKAINHSSANSSVILDDQQFLCTLWSKQVHFDECSYDPYQTSLSC